MPLQQNTPRMQHMADVTGSAQLARKVIINDVIPCDVIIHLCIIMIGFIGYYLTVWQDVVREI